MKPATMCGLTLGLLLLVGCSDTKEETFSSMALPEARSMVLRGWIPTVLPLSATDVTLRTNIDTNMVRGVASVSGGELDRLRAALRPLPEDSAPPFWPRGSVTPGWWPEDLLARDRPSQLRARGWEVYAVPDHEAAYMAFRASEGRVYFWAEGT